MFGDPTQDNTGFEQFKLSEIIEEGDKINYGVVQPGSEFPEGHHLIRAGNVVDGLVPENMKRIDPDIEQKYSRSRIKGNEILIVCVGSIGEVALVREEHIGFNIARAVCRIPVKNSIPRIYVSEYLKLASVQSRIQAEIREVAQPTLNIKQIKELVISIPETSKMEEFERMMNSVSSWESVLSSRSNQIENSLKSIAQELIS
jgi:type I restriction enzyme S subunit